MVVLMLKAMNDHLQKIAAMRDPVKALAEFVWNAVDADASEVSVGFGVNALGGIGSIVIKDNGNGITHARAVHDFDCLGDSWKMKTSLTPGSKRSLHGKLGQGRLKFYSLADTARWTTVYKEQDKLFRLAFEIAAKNLAYCEVPEPEPAPGGATTGTVVDLAPLKDTFDWLLSEAALMEFGAIFAPYILQYPDVKIHYNGVAVDPNFTIERSKELDFKKIVCPSGKVIENIGMRIVEWKKTNETRKIYFGGAAGVVLGSLPASIQAPGFDFSVYAYNPFFEEIAKANLLEFDNLSDPDFAHVLEHIKDATGDYFRARQAEKSGELIQELKDAGVYPYEGEPHDDVERRQRQVFDIATHAVSSYSREFKRADNGLKKITLGLLREAVGHNPESVVRILKAVFNLPKAGQDAFSSLLDKTELSNIISASSMIADRIVALKVLKEIVFDPTHRQTIKERGELDVLVRDNTWMFGENFHITLHESGLTKIMNRVSEELAMKHSKKKITKPDGKIGRVDSFMGRVVPGSNSSHREFLLLELKRPSLKVGRKETDQLVDYVSTILSQPDFVNTSNTWNFYLVTTEYDEVVKAHVTQSHRPTGLYLEGDNHKVWVKSWTEIIRECDARLQFVQEKLNIQVSDSEIEDRITKLKAAIIKADKIQTAQQTVLRINTLDAGDQPQPQM
jgi:hypothetical protein